MSVLQRLLHRTWVATSARCALSLYLYRKEFTRISSLNPSVPGLGATHQPRPRIPVEAGAAIPLQLWGANLDCFGALHLLELSLTAGALATGASRPRIVHCSIKCDSDKHCGRVLEVDAAHKTAGNCACRLTACAQCNARRHRRRRRHCHRLRAAAPQPPRRLCVALYPACRSAETSAYL